MKNTQRKTVKSYLTLKQRITAAVTAAVMLAQICIPTIALATTAWNGNFESRLANELNSPMIELINDLAAAEAYTGAYFIHKSTISNTTLDSFYETYTTERPDLKPAQKPKFIGDSFVQTRLIRAQYRALLGRYFFNGVLRAEEVEADAINNLYGAAKNYAAGNNLTLGSPLGNASSAPNMIWPELKQINGKSYLVPVVHLTEKTIVDDKWSGHLIEFDSSATFAGIQLDFATLITGYNSTITGLEGIINNSGNIQSAGNLTLVTNGTLANMGGTITAEQNASIYANDFYNKTLVVPYKDKNGEGTRLGRVASVDTKEGDLYISARNGITFEGANGSAGDTLRLEADGDINILPRQTGGTSESQSGHWEINKSTTELLMSRLAAEDTLSLIAGGVINITASELISSRGGIELLAGQGIHILDELTQEQIQKVDRKGKTTGQSSEFRTEAVRAILTAGKGVLLDSEFGDVTLKASEITSAEGAQVKAQNGTVHLLMTKELEEFHLQTVRKGTWTIKTRTEDVINENNIQNAIVGGLQVQAMYGINVEYTGKEGATLKEQIEEYRKMPGMEWMADIYNSCLIERDSPEGIDPIEANVGTELELDQSFINCGGQKVSWKEVQEIHEELRKTKSTLSPAAMAIIAICVAIATGGAGAGMLGAIQGSVTSALTGTIGASAASAVGASMAAGALTLTTQAAQSLAAGNNLSETLSAMDSSDSLKSLAVSMVTAGAMQAAQLDMFKIPEGTPIDAATIAKQAGQAVVNSTVSAGVSVAINGGNTKDFENAFVQSLAISAVSKLGEKMANKIGDASKAGNINDVVKYLAHAGAGCVIGVASAAASGSSDDNKYTCYSGAGGAVIGEFIADQYKDHVGITELEEAEYATREWLEENGLSTTMTDEQYNALTPTQQKELAALSPARFISASEFANLKAKGVDIAKLGAGLAAFTAGADVSIAAQTGENAAKNNALHLVIIGAYYAYRAYQAYVLVEAIVQLGVKINDIAEGRASYPTEEEFVAALESAILDFAVEKGLEKLLGGKKGAEALKIISDKMKSTGVGKNIVDELDRVVDALEGNKKYEVSSSRFDTQKALPSPKHNVPDGYTVQKNPDGTVKVLGPNNGEYNSTGFYDSEGRPIYKSGDHYFTLEGGRSPSKSPAPTNVEIHHVCSNNNCTWTPEFKKLFDNAGLDLNSPENLVPISGHYGPHPPEYHQYVHDKLSIAVENINPNTPEYKAALVNTLDFIKAESVIPGSTVNNWLTKPRGTY
jgi:filamentous hemagglutinin